MSQEELNAYWQRKLARETIEPMTPTPDGAVDHTARQDVAVLRVEHDAHRTHCAEVCERTGQERNAMRNDVSALKETLPRLERKLDNLSEGKERRFQWRTELLRAAVGILLAIIALGGPVLLAARAAMPEVKAAMIESVTDAFSEAAAADGAANPR